jgi:hypothetical protein
MILNNHKDKINIIYIAGYGRSGSTLLDLLLGINPSAFSMGEVASLFSENETNKLCACGSKINECPIWGKVLNNLKQGEDNQNNTSYEDKITRDIGGIKRVLPWNKDRDYEIIWNSVFNSLKDITNCKILIDSSKINRFTLFRIQLLKNMGYRISLVHLVRHPYSVIESVSRGNNKAIQYSDPKLNRFGGIYRAILGWLFSNWATEIFCYPLVDESIRIRYEDLVTYPSATLAEISKACNINISKALSAIANEDVLPVHHAVAGNRMRTENKGVKFIRKKMEETQPLYSPNFILRHLVKTMGKRYGYNI